MINYIFDLVLYDDYNFSNIDWNGFWLFLGIVIGIVIIFTTICAIVAFRKKK
mgnify:CR=1 FL=1